MNGRLPRRVRKRFQKNDRILSEFIERQGALDYSLIRKCRDEGNRFIFTFTLPDMFGQQLFYAIDCIVFFAKANALRVGAIEFLLTHFLVNLAPGRYDKLRKIIRKSVFLSEFAHHVNR